MIDLKKMLQAYELSYQLVDESGFLTQEFEEIKNNFEDKKKNPDASIMVYGVYNAGKSTLINALTGEEVAEVGDIPLTGTVSEYNCGSFKILDTPGIDAPIEHEKITQEQISKTDVIIFVINPRGVAEERKTFEMLMDLFEKRKKIFLVFNEKNKLSEDDFSYLKDNVYKVIQDLAYERGLQDVLSDIPIYRVNARQALKAKLENKNNLLSHSRFTEFERALYEFLSSVSQNDVNQRLKIILLDFLQKFVSFTQGQSKADIVVRYNGLKKAAFEEKTAITQQIDSMADKGKKEIYEQVKRWIYNGDQENVSKSLLDWTEKYYRLSLHEYNMKVEKIAIDFQMDIDDTINGINMVPNSSIDINQKDLNESIESQMNEEFLEDSKGFKIDKNQLILATSSLKSIEAQHIVMGLKAIKDIMPSLMKGIGEKTMEKWAIQAVGKVLPMIGSIATVGMAVYDIFGEDEETIRLNREQENAKRAEERRKRLIEDIAIDVSNQFFNEFKLYFYRENDEKFDLIFKKLNQISSEFNFDEQKNSAYLQRALGIQQLLQE